MLRGAPLFLLICALGAMPLVDRELGQVAVGVLAVLYLLTLTSVKKVRLDLAEWEAREASEWETYHRSELEQASAGRSSGEAVQTTREKDQSAF